MDAARLRADTVALLDAFDGSLWYADPLQTTVNGVAYDEGAVVQTLDAFEQANGNQVLAGGSVVDMAAEHVRRYRPLPSQVDLRGPIRAIEAAAGRGR